MIDVKPPKPLLHANFGGYFLFQDDGLCAASFHFPFDSCNATGCHAIALGCSVASRRFCGRLLEAYGKRTRTIYRDIVGFHVFYGRIHPFLDGNGRTGRMIMFRECLRGGLVPFIVLDADIILVSAAIRMFRHDGEGAFQSSFKHMVEPNLESSPPASS